MFARSPFSSPFEQYFGGYPAQPFQQLPYGVPPHLAGQLPFGQFPQQAGYQNVPWQIPPTAGIGPISPLVPQQMPYGAQQGFMPQQINPALLGAQQGASPFGGQLPGAADPSALMLGAMQGQFAPNPFAQPNLGPQQSYGGAPTGFQQAWQNDPRADLVANTIAQITATRDPRIEYLSKVVVHPLVASNPVLKDLVAKELLTAALQQVTIKSAVRPDLTGQTVARGGEQLGFGLPNQAFAAGIPTAM
jgi:hypothetical protein